MRKWPYFLVLSLVLITLLQSELPAQQKKKQKKDGPPPTTEQLLNEVKAPPGYKVTIFAGPPEVNYPTCLAAAPTGALFVGVDQNGSLDAKPGRGKILRLVDTKGEGVADKLTLFAKVDSPRGLVVDHKTIYVLHPPFLSAFHDDDGDGVADRSEVLVKGIGFDLKFRGADHTTNGIRMGIDGWIYIAVGDYGFVSAVGKDGKQVQLRGGGIARVRPDGTELELVSVGLRNIYDVAIDPYMNLFTRDNTNDGGAWDVRLNHDIPLGSYGYPSLFKNFGDEIIQPLADYGGGAPTGAMFTDESGFPAEAGRALLTCDWGRSAVYRHPLKQKGASFEAGQVPFIQIPRPTDIDVDGEGRMFISSWRGGSFTFAGPNIGYVIRVTHPSTKTEPFPNLQKSTLADLLRHLASSSGVRRQHAQREILRRPESPECKDGLERSCLAKNPLSARVAAIFTYKQKYGQQAQEFLTRLTKDEAVREFALRALADRKTELKGIALTLFQDALKDNDPRVRMQAVIGLARLGKIEAAESLLPLMTDADPYVAHASINALISLRVADACLGALDRADEKLTYGCVRVLQALHESKVVEGLLSRAETSKETKQRALLLRGLCRLYQREADWDGKWWGTRPDTSGPYFKPVLWKESDKIGQFLKKSLLTDDPDTLRSLLKEMARNKIDFPEATAQLLKLASSDSALRVFAVEALSGQSVLSEETIRLLEKIVVSAKEEASLRLKALRGLQRAAGTQTKALDATVHAFASFGDPSKAPKEFAALYSEFLRDPAHGRHVDFFLKLSSVKDAAQRELAYAVLLQLGSNKLASKEAKGAVLQAIDRAMSKPEAAISLLRAIGQVKAEEYGLQVRALQKSEDGLVRQTAGETAKLLDLDRPVQQRKNLIKGMKYEDILATALKDKGDARLGSQLFLKQGCIACHTVSPKEPVKGPYLGDVTSRYKRPELIESILKPSAKIAQGFETQFFLMTSGKTFEGFVVRESGDEVEIRDVAGLATVLKKSEIDERGRRPISVMPEQLADALTVHELASILAYLESLNTKK